MNNKLCLKVTRALPGFGAYPARLSSTMLNSASPDDSPQSFWIDKFQRKASSGYSPSQFPTILDFKKSLLLDLAKAMESFSADKFRTDYYFLLIWLAYINLQL